MPFDWNTFFPSPSDWFFTTVEYEGWNRLRSLILKGLWKGQPR